MLRKRVVDTAVDEINEKTDLEVSYTLEKQGRKVVAILFNVNGKHLFEKLEKTSQEIYQKLTAYGIPDKTAAKLLESHDEDYILANIRVVEESMQNGKEIHNIPAYLMKAFEVDFTASESSMSSLRKQEDIKKEQQQKEQEEQRKIEQELRQEFEDHKIKEVEKLLNSLNETALKELKEQFLVLIKENLLFSKILESK